MPEVPLLLISIPATCCSNSATLFAGLLIISSFETTCTVFELSNNSSSILGEETTVTSSRLICFSCELIIEFIAIIKITDSNFFIVFYFFSKLLLFSPILYFVNNK